MKTKLKLFIAIASIGIVCAEGDLNSDAASSVITSVKIINPDSNASDIEKIAKEGVVLKFARDADGKVIDGAFILGGKWRLTASKNPKNNLMIEIKLIQIDPKTGDKLGSEFTARGITILGDGSYIIHFE